MVNSERPVGELRKRLKESTRDLHDRVEATNFMGRLMSDDLTPAQYARTMRGLHALYAPLEAQLARVEGLSTTLPDLNARFKTASLKTDLEALPPEDQTVRPPQIDPITSVAAALGTLYVLEGSTIGGRMIASKLKTHAFVKPGSLHFFEHYGADGHRYWQRFTQILETLPADQHDQVLAAARRTFEYFIALGE